MREIQLVQSIRKPAAAPIPTVAFVDDEDYESMSQHEWKAMRCKGGKYFYAGRITIENGKKRTIYMHREILNASKGELVDHKNHDTTDCTRGNLRKATNSQNSQNRKMRSDCKTGFKGVHWHRKHKRWCARIQYEGRTHYGKDRKDASVAAMD